MKDKIDLINKDVNKDVNINIDVLLSNISKHGLRKNLLEQIMKIRPKYIIMITCCNKSLMNDLIILDPSYKMIKQFNYKTNFLVQITLLKII